MQCKTNWRRAQMIAAHRGIMIARAARVRYAAGEGLGDDRHHYYSVLLRYELIGSSSTLTADIVQAREMRRKVDHLRQLQRLRHDQKRIMREATPLPECLIDHVMRYVGW
jgi:hypothetical protein